MKLRTTIVGIAGAALVCAATLVAQDAREASAPSPDVLARMTPGEKHAKLDGLVGTWEMTGKWRMAPDAEWSDFEATAEREWVLDQHFLKETMTSEWMGQPFEGVGYIGYDNVREEYTMVWLDNMATGVATSTGRLEGGKIVFEGINSDPMTGEKKRWSRSVVDLSDHTYTGFSKDDAGNVFESMVMTANRR